MRPMRPSILKENNDANETNDTNETDEPNGTKEIDEMNVTIDTQRG